VAAHILNLSTIFRQEVSFTLPSLYPQEKSPSTHWLGGWLVPTSGLDTSAKRRKIPSLLLLGIKPHSSLHLFKKSHNSNITLKEGMLREVCSQHTSDIYMHLFMTGSQIAMEHSS